MAAKVAKQIATLDKWLEAAKDVLKLAIVTADTLGVGDSLQISGSGSWGATCSRRERTGIDLEMLKTEFGDAWIAQHSKTTNYYEIRFKEIK